MKRDGTMLTNLRQKLDLPGELQPMQSQITLTGTNEVTVYTHRGIGIYTAQQIQVRIQGGYANVNGEHLEIKRMNPLRLVIGGEIHGIALESIR